VRYYGRSGDGYHGDECSPYGRRVMRGDEAVMIGLADVERGVVLAGMKRTVFT